MAAASSRSIVVEFTGDVKSRQVFAPADNAASPAGSDVYTLAAGANTITVPGGGATVKGAIIIPPATNTQSLILKGVTGDTGVTLSKTDPTMLSFETAPASFVLTAGSTITGLRIVWV